jgi:hypothetical protein
MKIRSALALLSICGAALILSGCGQKDAQSTSQSSNPGISVDFLFEHDGCKLYRFNDNGHSVYYSKCMSSSTVSWNETEMVGKVMTTRPYLITTYYKG